MGKRSRIVLTILLVGCAAGMVWLAFRDREPVYKEKPLSYWLHGYDWKLSEIPDPGQPDARAADEAVKAAGVAAIPTLLRLLDYHESKMKRIKEYLESHLGNTDYHVKNSLHYGTWVGVPDAFGVLGSNGVSAVPRLLEIYRRNPDGMVKAYAISSLREIGPAARSATPVLVDILMQPDTNGYNLHYEACHALLNVKADPELSVPAFIKCLGDRDETVREAAVDCLGFLGTNARPAVPALIKLVKNDPRVKVNAQIALGKIDPAAATKAGVSVLLLVDPK